MFSLKPGKILMFCIALLRVVMEGRVMIFRNILLNSVVIIYALVVITMVCRKKVSVRIKSLITSAVT